MWPTWFDVTLMRRLLPPRVLCVVAGVALAAPAGAGDPAAGPYTLKLSGQLRVRVESDDNLDLRGYRPAFTDTFALSRLSLEMDVRAKGRPRFHLQLRDARAFGSALGDSDFPASNPIHDPLDVREAFVEWRDVGGSALGFTVGRQRIAYGDERVFGPGEWGNTGRWTWDAARGHVEHGALWVDAWVGRAVVNRPDSWPNSSAGGVRAAVLYGGVRRGEDRLDLFAGEKRDDTMRRGERRTGSLRCRFIGLQADAALAGPWRWGVTAVHETGHTADDSIDALGASAWLAVRLGGAWKALATVASTYGSGDRDPHDGVHGAFDGVFGGADIRFYGYLNLVFWANVWDYEARVELHPAEGLAVRFEGHCFQLAQARDAWYSTGLQAVRRDPSGAAGGDLGWELDTRAIWSPRPALELAAGGGWFAPGSFVERTGPAPHASWGFVQTTWRF
jgi:hypothetical protein